MKSCSRLCFKKKIVVDVFYNLIVNIMKGESKMANYVNIKLVTTPIYHLWCDALHARTLARQTTDDWMRGTYVRWTVITAWAVLELCCQEAVGDTNVTKNLRANLDKKVSNRRLQPIDWDNGIWKEVLELKDSRVYYIHLNYRQEDLWPDIMLAEKVISIIREACKDIFNKASKTCPYNLDDDSEKGWS